MSDQYNPSKRKNPRIRVKQIQQGILEYKDEIGTVLIAIQTRELDAFCMDPADPTNPKRELCGVQWGIGSEYSVGNRVNLCPRDVDIFRELLKYLERQYIHIGDDTKRNPCRREEVYDFSLRGKKLKKRRVCKK